jgi:S-adenosylmethionine uptake transporter
VWRAIFGFVALTLCCYSVNIMPLAENTTIMFAEPLFFLPLAVFFLSEKVDVSRWSATIIGFLGLLIIVQPGTNTFRPEALIPMTAAFLFASLNVMAKKMITTKENTLTMLFYFGLGTTILCVPFLHMVWQTPTLTELFFLTLLGVGANMIQVCLFRAFNAADASSLMPFRYTEFALSAILGFLFFGQVPTLVTFLGATLIISSTFYMSYHEIKREKRVNKELEAQSKAA